MKIPNSLIFLVIFTSILSCNEKKSDTSEETSGEPVFNQELADSLGADDYGMRKYVMAFLKKGPNRDLDSAASAQLQRAHLDNIVKLANAGKLSVAGPFLDDTEIRGIYIFNVSSVEEAKTLTETDPAIQAGSLVMELKPWYGSAAIQMVNENHKSIAKEKI